MAKYLAQVKYAAAGMKGLQSEGGSRRKAAVESLVAGVGGSVDACYYAFGDVDLFVIMDVPDPAAAAAVSLAANASGAVSVTVTPLLSVEDIDAAARLTPGYQPPGT